MRNQLDPTTLTRNLASAQESAAVVEQAASAGTSNPGILHNNGVRYRIYTELRHNLLGLTSDLFASATLMVAMGLWEGLKEESAIIEIVGADVDYHKVLKLAETIRDTNNQSAVLVTRESIASVLV